MRKQKNRSSYGIIFLMVLVLLTIAKATYNEASNNKEDITPVYKEEK